MANQPIVPHPAIAKKGEQTKLYVAIFSADWCGACAGVPDFIKTLRGEGFSVYKFDFDRSRLAKLKLGIKRVPSIVVMNKGKVVKKFIGAPKRFLAELQKLLQTLRAKEAITTSPNYLLG